MKNIEHIIWDMDGVLYPFTDACVQATIAATAHAVCALSSSFQYDDALNEAVLSHQEHRNPFITLTQQYGLDFDTLVRATYKQIDMRDMIQPDAATAALIRAFGRNQAILTRADMAWTQRVIDRLGLGDIFGEHNIIAADNAPDMDKAASTRPFLMMLDKTGFNPAQTIMVEDTMQNLAFAKNAGLMTALVHAQDTANKPPFVDHIFETTPHFLRMLG